MIPLLLLLGCTDTEGPIVYRFLSDPLSGDGLAELSLDMREPDPAVHGDGPYPAVVYFHGGGWLSGNLYSNGLERRIERAADRGYVAVTANVRLTGPDDAFGAPRWPWPAQLGDARCVIRWLRSRAGTYRVDPDRIGAVGISTGGQLAMMLAITPDVDSFDDSCAHPATPEVQAAVSWGGPTDLSASFASTTPVARSWIRRLLDLPAFHDPGVQAAPYRDASPAFWIRDAVVPTLQLQGLDDPITPAEVTELTHGSLLSVGTDAELVTFEGAGHELRGRDRTDALEAEDAFLDRHLSE